jgi:hypothetical protein
MQAWKVVGPGANIIMEVRAQTKKPSMKYRKHKIENSKKLQKSKF